jgi:hypothetical protein
MTKPKASFLFALGRPGVIKGGKSIAGVPMAIAYHTVAKGMGLARCNGFTG